MTYRRIFISRDNDDIRRRFERCETCRLTYNSENLFGGICRKCHYPYISLSEFIKNNPNPKFIHQHRPSCQHSSFDNK